MNFQNGTFLKLKFSFQSLNRTIFIIKFKFLPDFRISKIKGFNSSLKVFLLIFITYWGLFLSKINCSILCPSVFKFKYIYPLYEIFLFNLKLYA